MRGIPGVNEKDWKLFRSRIPDWQEAYMDRLNHEYIELLSGEGNPSDKFWALEERILMDLLDEGAITAADLDGFSDDLRDSLLTYIELRKRRENQ